MSKTVFALSVVVLVGCGGQTFEAGAAGAAGSGQAGSSNGGSSGSSQGGSAGTSGAGGASCGCAKDADCGPGKNCAKGVCKEIIGGRCWDDDECGAGATCQGATVCPCGAACTVEDSPGSCKGMGLEWSSCAQPGECLLAPKSCCGVCTVPKVNDLDAVNYTKLQAHFEEVCPAPVGCPACAAGSNPSLLATCELNKCEVSNIEKHALSACEKDADCTLHAANECCSCTLKPPGDYVAVAASKVHAYELEVCGAGKGPCKVNCASQFPPGLSAKCGGDGHCKVVAEEAAACPPALPGGGPCPKLGLECEYGEQVAIGCRARASCTEGGWVQAAASCPAPLTPGMDGCPVKVVDGGGSCKNEGAVCALADGASCVCTGCAGGPCSPDTKWRCAGPGVAPCPKVAPNLGQPCPTANQKCTYGAACTATATTRICTEGVWREELIACPE